MADPTVTKTLNTIGIACREHILPQMIDQIINSNYLVSKLMPKTKTIGGGAWIEQQLEYGDERPQWLAEWDKRVYNKREFATAAVYNWRRLFDAIAFSELDLAVKNTGPERIISITEVATKNVTKTFKRGFQDMLMNTRAATAKEPINLYDIIFNYATALGGITATWWQARKLTATSTYDQLTDPTQATHYLENIMGYMYDALCSDNDHPDVIVTTKNIWRCYEQLLRRSGRYDNAYKLVNGTFETLKFGLADVVWDTKCPTGYMYFLNTNYLYFVAHRDFNFKLGDFKELPTGESAWGMDLVWYGAFTCSNRAYQGGIFAIPETSITIL